MTQPQLAPIQINAMKLDLAQNSPQTAILSLSNPIATALIVLTRDQLMQLAAQSEKVANSLTGLATPPRGLYLPGGQHE